MKDVVVFTEICGVCKEEIVFIKDFDYIDPDGVCRAFKPQDPNTGMCDNGSDKCCFKTYHDKCFSLHQCDAHNPEKPL